MRLLFISDTHFLCTKETEERVWLNRLMADKWDEIEQDFVTEIKKLNPDAIIHCGDITQNGTVEDFAFGKKILDAIGINWYAVPGNHDTGTDEITKRMRKMYAVSADGFCYSKIFGGIAIAFFDVCNRGENNLFYIDGSVLDWLENFIKENIDKTVFLVCHIPVRHRTVIADHGTFNCGGRIIYGRLFGRYFDKVIGKIENVAKLRKIIADSSNVKAVFSGHWHINSLHVSNGVYYKTVPSICEYPCEVVIADCGTNGIRVYNKTLASLGWHEKSLIPELNNKWVAGSKKARDTVII